MCTEECSPRRGELALNHVGSVPYSNLNNSASTLCFALFATFVIPPNRGFQVFFEICLPFYAAAFAAVTFPFLG
jgi:hypothetical protein